MTVIPLRRPSVASPLLALRMDLRTRLTAAAVLQAEVTDANDLDRAAQARERWAASARAVTFALKPARALYEDAASAGAFAELLAAAGFEPRRTELELDEAVLADTSLAGAERLRARGFGLGLRIAQGCPLPLGARERKLFSEFLTPTPARIDPFLGCEGWQDHPLATRVFAAQASGVTVTALGVHDPVMARALIAAGFDRGEGDYAGYL